MRHPKLDLKHLQMIRAIGRTGRVVDAADALGLTPSALSHRIKEAERRLGVPLFERLHKRLRMTAAAEYLAAFSDQFMAELERVEDEVRRMNAGVDHVVRLTVEAYGAYHWLPDFLETMEQVDPRISLQIMVGAGRDLGQELMSRRLDLALVSGEASISGARYLPGFDDPLVFICAPDHRLASRAAVGADDIENERFITYTKVPEPDREFARLFRAESRYPRWTATVEQPEAIVELVAAGRGASVLASWAVAPFIASGRICAIPLRPDPILIRWRCMFRDDEPEEGPVRRVAGALSRWLAAQDFSGST